MTTILEWRTIDGTEIHGKSLPFPIPGTLGTPMATVTPFDPTYLAAAGIPPSGALLTTGGNGVNTTPGLLDAVADSAFTNGTLVAGKVANAISGILRNAYTTDDQMYLRAAQIVQPSPVFQPTINFIPHNPGGTINGINFGTPGSLANLITAIGNAVGSLTGQAAIDAAVAAWASIMPSNADLQALMGKTYGCTNMLSIFTAAKHVDSLFGSSQVIDFNKPAATNADSSFFDAVSVIQNGTNTGGNAGDFRVRVSFNPLALLGN